MAKEGKNRCLLLLRYLWEHTDQAHPVTIREMQAYLTQQGISAGRKTISGDMAELAQAGFDVVCNKRQQNQYFLGARDFELPELMLLMDAVQAAQFIRPDKRETLVEKLSKQTSTHLAKELTRRIQVGTPPSAQNPSLYYVMDALRNAGYSGHLVTFQYFDYTPKKKQVLKHDGQVYRFSPYDLMWNGDRYYAIGYSEHHEKVVTFRVDRMTNLIVTEEMASPPPNDYQVEDYRKQVFQMYDVEHHRVVLRCQSDLMGVIIDRFGIDVKTKPVSGTHFEVTVDVSVSPTFYGWLFTFAGEMEVVSPAEVVEGYRERLQVALE